MSGRTDRLFSLFVCSLHINEERLVKPTYQHISNITKKGFTSKHKHAVKLSPWDPLKLLADGYV